ncbi:MAG TPA: hypothetical protein K8U78_04075 [Aeriscardovia aeriphila]|uniref:Uncharacterized protein n=1 Tax=Aeriscardovia aeriphila TaxID=218139 RepID=A0A921FVV0_9BIFI|nr:hypothetical protein [Aeriscardovia aeriphila]HJF18317.1 hypothetical protein [Aeriscardovia aeriphila]
MALAPFCGLPDSYHGSHRIFKARVQFLTYGQPTNVTVCYTDHAHPDEESIAMAQKVILVTMRAMDIVRKKMPEKVLDDKASPVVIQRLVNMREIMTYFNIVFGKPQALANKLPVTMSGIHITFTNDSTVEASLAMWIGQETHQGCVVMRKDGQRWLSVFLDIG